MYNTKAVKPRIRLLQGLLLGSVAQLCSIRISIEHTERERVLQKLMQTGGNINMAVVIMKLAIISVESCIATPFPVHSH